MPHHLVPSLIAGLFASVLFLVVITLGPGFVFLFLPTLPLFLVGFSGGARAGLIALGTASVLIFLPVGLAPSIVFLLLLGVPAWAMIRKSLLYKDISGQPRLWFPIGLMMLDFAIYGAVLIALLVFHYADEPGGLPKIIAQNIHVAFADMQGQYGDLIDMLAGAWSFLIFPITLWLWGMTLYAHAWIANRALRYKHKEIRSDFSVRPFIMPGWVLSLLAICALASLIGSPQMSFLGKSVLITLLLPYFFLGAAVMHETARKTPNGRFILFFVYFMVFSQFWPALLLSGTGLWQQIKCLSGTKTSFKS